MSRRQTTDPRQGNAGDLGEWLSKPKNRAKVYAHDRAAAAELAAMREQETAQGAPTADTSTKATNEPQPERWSRTPNPKE